MARIVEWPQQTAAQSAVATDAAAVLEHGGLVVYPTDTVYGLGALPGDPAAIQRIYEVKGRPDEKAIIWLLAGLGSIEGACEVDSRVSRLTEAFWPGALTLILRRLQPPPGAIQTQGVRVPAHPAALAVIRAAGGCVATTSANRSGEPSARNAAEAASTIGSRVDLILDAGPAPGGTESTILDLSSDPPRVLRHGAISAEELESVMGSAVQRPA